MKHSLSIASLHSVLSTPFIGLMLFVAVGCVARPMPNATSSSQQPTELNASAIDINRASADDIEKLPGIGRVMAERIVAYRDSYGPFRRPEHLMMVRGMSEQKFWAISSRITAK